MRKLTRFQVMVEVGEALLTMIVVAIATATLLVLFSTVFPL